MFADPKRPKTNNWVYLATATGAASLYLIGKNAINAAVEFSKNIFNYQFDQALGNGVAVSLSIPVLILFGYLEKEAIKESAKKLTYDIKHLF